ncbi:PaaI family thioesterase [Maridesulfovibrio sp.]|uniref:PaaI family thioesterase n=1 Tax=Maridesulfovibrio sp. TaxID=2795000 RepID=UPI0029F4DB73|nr:PaaI family thioesterase [Maridesulfovibrio sp.]
MSDYESYMKNLTEGNPVDNPFLDFMGIRAEEIREGYARMSMEIRPEFIQGAGNIQGGLSIALSSETAAHAVMTTLNSGEDMVTVELKNNFLATASKGRLTAEATVFKRGRTLIIVDTVVRDDHAKDISRSSATLMVLRRE